MEKLRNEVIMVMRGCLVSTKGKVPMRQLDADYRTLVGEKIPFFKLGFKKLEDFIQSEPSLVLTRHSNGDLFVDAKISEKSAHITEMVAMQKPEKKKVLRKAVRFSHSQYPAKTTKWRPRDVNPRGKKFSTSSRPAAVSHNQFVTRPSYDKPAVPSKIVIPETSGLYKNPQMQRQNSQLKKDINSRLHLSNTHNDRQVSDNGLSVTIQTQNGRKMAQDVGNKMLEDTCSPLLSTKKRITKKMSEINLNDRDSGNSSPTGISA
ncbi:hypothetical protein NQ317_004821 [Molorchus minor]|uniref:HTH OST-type domain-containing protein n=1 Tax=Molorchus minor TaxID=1323400 RepID=A0ABQ9JC60_9CUCU|nr:hypothetical protein NQ317_004821 [Molorchus minor]